MRTQKWYRRNEQKVMKELGFEPTPNSGAGWIFKEDGQTDFTIAQLKSTDASSISIRLLDLQKLESNAITAHKNPVFVIQFIKDGSIYLILRPDPEILEVIHKEQKVRQVQLAQEVHKISEEIAGSAKSREKFHKKREETRIEQAETYRKVRRAHRKEKPKRILDPGIPL